MRFLKKTLQAFAFYKYCSTSSNMADMSGVRYEEILQEMKAATGKGSRKSTGSRSPQSISLQRVASDQTSGKSDKQRQLEEERARLDKEKADFEEWKKRFLH